jgi:diadenosine tetraphosphate (Ap4A) HIT family hydrolase
MEACIFCQIAKGQAPGHTIWEDEQHLAFLTRGIFPRMTISAPMMRR